ncbi:MAG: hypothetical protein LBF22_08090 [Deltaproteobacteria bacterium]|jgi:hypothetical protein|nr:hypothetical protein [Deltaproteobacteria bacterium]
MLEEHHSKRIYETIGKEIREKYQFQLVVYQKIRQNPVFLPKDSSELQGLNFFLRLFSQKTHENLVIFKKMSQEEGFLEGLSTTLYLSGNLPYWCILWPINNRCYLSLMILSIS